MTDRTDAVLELIDNVLAGEGPDVMRGTPDPPKAPTSTPGNIDLLPFDRLPVSFRVAVEGTAVAMVQLGAALHTACESAAIRLPSLSVEGVRLPGGPVVLWPAGCPPQLWAPNEKGRRARRIERRRARRARDRWVRDQVRLRSALRRLPR